MDAFDYREPEKPTPRRDYRGILWNLLTVLVLLTTLCLGGMFLMVFINPAVGFNPFPPPTLVPAVDYPTPTPTARPLLPPTWTPTVTLEPTATSTPRPTSTPFITETPLGAPITEPTATPVPGGLSFKLHQGSPKALPNIYHPDFGCNWMGVSGKAFDLTGAPVVGLIVQLGGYLEGQRIDMLTLTSANGYEFTIFDRAIESNDALWVQLFAIGDLPMSEKIYFDTYNDCEKNLIIVDFTQVR